MTSADEVRRAIDAVIIVAHFEREGQRWVYLRSALRPPFYFRDPKRSPVAEAANGALWELPAGLIEPGEQNDGGVGVDPLDRLRQNTGLHQRADHGVLVGHGGGTNDAVMV